MTIGDRIRNRRIELGLSQDEVAKRLGYKSRSSVNKIETAREIPSRKIEEMARILDCSPGYIMGWTEDDQNTESQAKGFKIPVVGRVAAGLPIEASEEIIDWEELPMSMHTKGEFFGLKIKGHSMEPRIEDGDTVIVRKQDYAEDGEIVIALVNGDDGVCKKLKKYPDSIALVSLNPAYAPMIFTAEEQASKPVRIIGKVVELRGKF